MTTRGKRGYKKSTTPVEVLQECLLDIRDGLWLCGTLGETNEDAHHVAKPKGCAMGLVGLNSGNFKAVHGVDDAIGVTGWLLTNQWSDGSADTFYNLEEIDSDGWNALGQKTAEYLALASGKDVQPAEDPCVYEEAIVSHNDSTCKSPDDARKWFTKALELATEDSLK